MHEGQTMFDLAMCEFKYQGRGHENEANCYDRNWDSHEIYEDDSH